MFLLQDKTMKQPFKIVISPEGNISFVYSEVMNLLSLGKPTIHRATEVAFDNTNGSWNIYTLPPIFKQRELLATGFAKRSDALAFEIEYLCENMEKIVNESL